MKRHLQSHCAVLVLALSLLALPALAQFDYTTNNGTITITRYTGPGGDVVIPSTINGLPVTSIGTGAFASCHGLFSVTTGSGLCNIGDYAFFGCEHMACIILPASIRYVGYGAFTATGIVNGGAIYFLGDDTDLQAEKMFWFIGHSQDTDRAIICYPTWADGWGPSFDGIRTQPWNPVGWLDYLIDESHVANPKPLLASLSAAQKSIGRGNRGTAANHLRTFQKKVCAQMGESDAIQRLIGAVQLVIDAL